MTPKIADNPVPRWTAGAVAFVEKYLKPDHKVFEWGCGGSTIWMAKRVRFIQSVDHDSEWVCAVNDRLDDLYQRGTCDCEGWVCVIPPEKGLPLPHVLGNCRSEVMSDERIHFTSYVNFIHKRATLRDSAFDFIVIDGRARPDCMLAVQHSGRLNSGGLLLLDNSERARYAQVVKLATKSWGFEVVHRSRDKGLCGDVTSWETTIWRKK